MPEGGENPLARWGALIARHEGIAFTLLYLALATIGIVHLASFYAEFRVGVLQFAEVSDFLLAPIRDPLVVLLTVLPVPVLALLNWMGRRFGATWNRVRKTPEDPVKRARAERQARILWPIALVLWMLAFNLTYVNWITDRIKAGKGRQVRAVLVDGRPVATAPDSTVTLLPGTTQFSFFYRVREREVVVVPNENLQSITFAGRRRPAP